MKLANSSRNATARREAIDVHKNLLDKQPDNGAEATEFTHYDCWFLPPDKEYTFDHLEEAMRRTPRDVAAHCQRTFSSWMKTLDIPPPPEGWFADLYMRGHDEYVRRTGLTDEGAGWAGIAEAETDAVLRVLEAGYKVYEGSCFWEIYADLEVSE